MDTTICGISTAVGTGAISIIRCSGNNAISIVNSIFKGANLNTVLSHTINYGHIIDKNEIVDEVLVSIMKSPKTFTKEDIAEINCHGGISTTNKVLELLLSNGCKLAEPGEFTKRAFLNGRIDLLEAEAICDLINSETEKSRKMAVNQITGQLSDLIKNIRKKLIELLAKIEVQIDYPEYEAEAVLTKSLLLPELEKIKVELHNLLLTAEQGNIVKNGITVALIGKPNVGKSSVLNSFLNEQKAIVTTIAGTTRDVVEGKINLNGILLNILDTAGIRTTDNEVEKIGVEKSLLLSKKADLNIYVIDNNKGIDIADIEILNSLKNKKCIIFINKNDLKGNVDLKNFKKFKIVYGNTIEKTGIDDLKKAISEMFELKELETIDYTFLSNARQIALVKQTIENIEEAIHELNKGMTIDMMSINIQQAYSILGEIIGETYKDDLLNELFSKFCLGK